jgi:hypothetical protein
MINLLPVLPLFPVAVMHNWGQLSTVFGKLSTGSGKIGVKLALTSLLVFYSGRTAWQLFAVWPQNDEVQFVWQAALTETAVYLNNSPDVSPVAIGGWSPETMDPPTMQLALQRDDLDLRYFGSDSMTAPINTLILPGGSDTIRITRPAIRPFAPALESQLHNWGAAIQEHNTFTNYELQITDFAPQHPANANFANELQFLGYSTVNPQSSIITFWEVTAVPTAPRRFFAHLLDEDGNIISQHDSLDAPAVHWQPGDILVQFHELDADAAISAQLRLGVYNPDTCTPGPCQNLNAADGRPFLLLPIE